MGMVTHEHGWHGEAIDDVPTSSVVPSFGAPGRHATGACCRSPARSVDGLQDVHVTDHDEMPSPDLRPAVLVGSAECPEGGRYGVVKLLAARGAP
jgi:hypothetical protein